MRKFSLVLGIFFTFNFIWSILWDDSSTDKILWIETNIWIVRIIKAIIATVLICIFFKEKTQKKKNDLKLLSLKSHKL